MKRPSPLAYALIVVAAILVLATIWPAFRDVLVTILTIIFH